MEVLWQEGAQTRQGKAHALEHCYNIAEVNLTV